LHWSEARTAFERRLTAIEQRIAEFPLSAPEVKQRPGVRVVAFVDLPYRLFYSLESDAANVLAVRHTSRQSQF
jgi:plasmid stabilization system protein ParE